MIRYYYRRTRRLLPKRNKYSDCSLVHTCLSPCPLLSPPPKNVATIFISSSTTLLLCTPSYANMIPILYFKMVHTNRASENISISWERVGESSVPPLLFSCCEREQNDLQCQWNPDNKEYSNQRVSLLSFFFLIRHNDARTRSTSLSSFLRKKAT